MKPSVALRIHADRVHALLERSRMDNPRIFGATARGEDGEHSDLDILVDVPDGFSLYDMARVETELESLLGCKVDLLTAVFMPPDVEQRIYADLLPLP